MTEGMILKLVLMAKFAQYAGNSVLQRWSDDELAKSVWQIVFNAN